MKDRAAEAEQDRDLGTIGGRIRYARIAQGLTQQDVADALPNIPGRKKSRASIAQYEMGNPPGLDVLVDLAAILNENPCYLAFGGEVADLGSTPKGHKIPVKFKDEDAGEDCAFLPRRLLEEIGAGQGQLEIVCLMVDAPTHGIRKQDYLLVDSAISTIKADGQLYAVATFAGSALVRSEPLPSQNGEEAILLISGQGMPYSLPSGSVKVLGRVIASLQRRS